MKLNIIWMLNKNGIYEVDWIKYIFSDFEIMEFDDPQCEFKYRLNNSLIVIQNISDNHNFEIYLNSLLNDDINFKILHISDEALNHNIKFYEKFSNKIIRMFYSEEYTKKYNLLTIPLGYKSGVKKIETEENKYLVNFIGQLKSDRYQMASEYSNVEPKFFKFTNQWNDPLGLSTHDYSLILSQSSFTLCPSGWVSVDSFRINESLECGSIPVSVLYNGKNYFNSIYGENPFIIGENWKDTINLIKNTDIKLKREEVKIWWDDYKKNLKNKLNLFLLKKY